MELLKGYRTLIINCLTVLAAALGAVPPEWQDTAIIILGLVNIALRYLTTTAVGKPA
jgi:hypothetical protein